MHPSIVFTLFVVLCDFGMSFHFTSYGPFLQSLGLSLSDIALVNVCFWATALLFEIPTGIIADKIGRAWSVRFGMALLGIGHLAYAIACGFISAVIAEILVGVGAAFISGALDAWLRDALLHRQEDERYRRVIGNSERLRALALMIGGVLGGFLAVRSYRFPWILAVLVYAILTLLSFHLMKNDADRSLRQRQYDATTDPLRKSWQLLRTRRDLRWAVAASAAFGLMLPFNHFWTPYYKQQFGQTGVSILWIPMMGSLALAGELVRRGIFHRRHDALVIPMTLFVAGGSLALLGFAHSFDLTIGVIIVHEIARGLFASLHRIYTQEHIERAFRATYSSLQSFLQKIGFVVTLILVWWMTHDRSSTDPTTVTDTWILFGSLLAFLALIFLLVRPRSR